MLGTFPCGLGLGFARRRCVSDQQTFYSFVLANKLTLAFPGDTRPQYWAYFWQYLLHGPFSQRGSRRMYFNPGKYEVYSKWTEQTVEIAKKDLIHMNNFPNAWGMDWIEHWTADPQYHITTYYRK